MSTLFIAAILVGIVAALIFLLVVLDKKQKQDAMDQLLHAFHQAGAEHNLIFSSQEMLKDSILGLDGVHRKVLVLERDAGGAFHAVVIDLSEVKSCSVKKEYGAINGGDLKVKNLEQYLKTIALHFVLYNKPEVRVVYYNYINEDIYAIAELENKAKHWVAILSKLVAPVKKIA